MRDLPYDNYMMSRFDTICKKLRESGYDLSKIKIVMKDGHKGTYTTKRIMEELNTFNHVS